MVKNYAPSAPVPYDEEEERIQIPGRTMVVLDAPVGYSMPQHAPMLPASPADLQPYAEPSAVLFSPGPPVLRQQSRLSITDRRGFLAPPVVVNTAKFRGFLHALQHIAVPRQQAVDQSKWVISGIRIVYRGDGNLVLEATNEREFASVILPVVKAEPSGPWSIVVPAEGVVRQLSEHSEGEVEVAPSDRFRVGPYSFQPTGNPDQFPAWPTRPQDLENKDATVRTVAWQVIIKREDLKLGLRRVAPIIQPDENRIPLRNLQVNPTQRFLAASDRYQARYLTADIRSRPRLEHASPFYVPVTMAKAAAILEPTEFVLFTVTQAKEVWVAGRDDQDYFIYADSIGHQDVINFSEFLPNCQNEFTFNRLSLLRYLQEAEQLFRDEEQAYVFHLSFGSSSLAMMASLDTKEDSRNDFHREVPYIMAMQSSMLHREFCFRASHLRGNLEAIQTERVILGFPRNAGAKDTLSIYTPDRGFIAVACPFQPREKGTT